MRITRAPFRHGFRGVGGQVHDRLGNVQGRSADVPEIRIRLLFLGRFPIGDIQTVPQKCMDALIGHRDRQHLQPAGFPRFGPAPEFILIRLRRIRFLKTLFLEDLRPVFRMDKIEKLGPDHLRIGVSDTRDRYRR
jgi:hypothetical protein